MTDKTIESVNKVGGDYFWLYYSRRYNKYLDYYLKMFDINDYYIYKSTNKFRRITIIEDLYEFKYSGYIFFKKSVYNYKEIDEWINFINISPNLSLKYLIKPFPPIEIIDKINIIK